MIEEAVKALGDVDLDHVVTGAGGYTNVYLTFKSSHLTIEARGERLLEIEDALINDVDSKIRVWHVPIGDKNSLRKLRGVNLI